MPSEYYGFSRSANKGDIKNDNVSDMFSSKSETGEYSLTVRYLIEAQDVLPNTQFDIGIGTDSVTVKSSGSLVSEPSEFISDLSTDSSIFDRMKAGSAGINYTTGERTVPVVTDNIVSGDAEADLTPFVWDSSTNSYGANPTYVGRYGFSYHDDQEGTNAPLITYSGSSSDSNVRAFFAGSAEGAYSYAHVTIDLATSGGVVTMPGQVRDLTIGENTIGVKLEGDPFSSIDPSATHYFSVYTYGTFLDQSVFDNINNNFRQPMIDSVGSELGFLLSTEPYYPPTEVWANDCDDSSHADIFGFSLLDGTDVQALGKTIQGGRELDSGYGDGNVHDVRLLVALYDGQYASMLVVTQRDEQVFQGDAMILSILGEEFYLEAQQTTPANQDVLFTSQEEFGRGGPAGTILDLWKTGQNLVAPYTLAVAPPVGITVADIDSSSNNEIWGYSSIDQASFPGVFNPQLSLIAGGSINFPLNPVVSLFIATHAVNGFAVYVLMNISQPISQDAEMDIELDGTLITTTAYSGGPANTDVLFQSGASMGLQSLYDSLKSKEGELVSLILGEIGGEE